MFPYLEAKCSVWRYKTWLWTKGHTNQWRCIWSFPPKKARTVYSTMLLFCLSVCVCEEAGGSSWQASPAAGPALSFTSDRLHTYCSMTFDVFLQFAVRLISQICLKYLQSPRAGWLAQWHRGRVRERQRQRDRETERQRWCRGGDGVHGASITSKGRL